MDYRFFVESYENGCRTLLLMELTYDRDLDWYQIRVFLGEEMIGYVHGYANKGWTPQVNNIWVAENHRRKRIASAMMAKLEDFFGQIPLPATPIEDNEAAKGFWSTFTKGTWVEQGEKRARRPPEERPSFLTGKANHDNSENT
ncbi:MAG: GNAT family N-acetyltransferase [Thermodesulfobacteriota bacterium]